MGKMSHYNPDKLEAQSRTRAPIHDKAYFMRLRRRLRWQMLVAYLTPLILVSVVFHLQYTATLRSGIDNHLKSIADHQRNIVDLYLRERVSNLRGAIRFGAQAITADRVDMNKLLVDLQQESPAFVDVGLFDAQGKLVAYAGPHGWLIGKSYRKERWWRQLHGQRRTYLISDVYLGFRRRPHFVIAVRHLLNGKPWTLRASVDPKRFSEFVRKSYLIKTSEALIVNARGERQTVVPNATDSSELIRVPGRTRQSQVSEASVRGHGYVMASAWLAELDWVLVVRVPRAAAYAPLRRATGLLVGAVLVAVLLVVALVIRSSGRLVGKLERADLARADLRGQLFQAAKLASVGEMAAGVAHEINNPLAIIYEEAGMMKDALDPQFGQDVDLADFAERLGAIEEATLRGRSITRKLLAFARQHESGAEPAAGPGPQGQGDRVQGLEHRGGARARAAPAGGGDQPQPARPGRAQPFEQCQGRHERRRTHRHPYALRRQERQLRHPGQRVRHDPQAARERVLPLLHDQGGREGHRFGAVHQLRDRQLHEREHRRGQRGGSGHDLHGFHTAGGP
jgi:two-component system NtrC family sensor kinase